MRENGVMEWWKIGMVEERKNGSLGIRVGGVMENRGTLWKASLAGRENGEMRE